MAEENKPMRVTIVGGGLGGIACAIACRRHNFEVAVYDQVKEFLRIGDSIGFGSNSARLLYRWGVGEELEKISSNAKEIRMYNFDSSEALLMADTSIATAEADYGCRGLIGHRGDYHLILKNFAEKMGVSFFMDQHIEKVDASKPSITLRSGVEIVSDVTICADGAKSQCRAVVLDELDVPLHSGYAIYRAFMDGDLLSNDPVAGKFVEHGDVINLFLGPDMHGFLTTLRDGKEVNCVLTHKDTGDIEESWTKPGDIDDVLKLLEGWDPAFVRAWEKMPNCIDWKLVYRPCLSKWVADSGLMTLMGDAAHPFLPTSTQGASQAIEDGATIALCLAKAGKGNVPLALHTFFELRHDYVADAQATGIRQREKWHNLHDKESKDFKESFDINDIRQSNYHLWKNDAEKVVEDHWNEVSSRVKERLDVCSY